MSYQDQRYQNAGGSQTGNQNKSASHNWASKHEPLNLQTKEFKRNLNAKSFLAQPLTGGRNLNVACNFFKLNVPATGKFYQYNFWVNPSNGNKSGNYNRYCSGIQKSKIPSLLKEYSKKMGNILIENEFVYDRHRNLFTRNQLKLSDTDNRLLVPLKNERDGRIKNYELQLKLVNVIDLDILLDFYNGKASEIPQVLSEIFQVLINAHMQRIPGLVCLNKDNIFYDMTNRQPVPSNPNFETVQGFETSVAFAEVGATLNLGIKSCTLFKGGVSLLELLEALCKRKLQNGESLNPNINKEFNKLANGVHFYVKHFGKSKTFIFKRLTERYPSQTCFSCKSSETGKNLLTNVKDYFKKTYKINTKEFPCIETVRGEFFPLELAYLKPNQIIKYETKDISQDIIEASQIKPVHYFEKCQTVARYLSEELKKSSSKLGVSLDPSLIKLSACELRLNKVESRRFHRVKIALLLSKKLDDQWVEELKRDIISHGRSANMEIKFSCATTLASEHMANLDKYMKFIQEKTIETKTDLVLFGNQTQGQVQTYQNLKFSSDFVNCVPTQVFLIEKTKNQRLRSGFLRNLMTSCRGKIGIKEAMVDPACLDRLGFDRRKTMVVGVDVIHPSDMLGARNDQTKCSLAGIVGSIDADFYHYVSNARVQIFNGCETVCEIGLMFKKLLKFYWQKNHFYPESYIIFRDGVSREQMLTAVKEVELMQLKQAIYDTTKTNNFKMTTLVVPKRHFTRFLNLENPTENIPKGMGVFESIVEPKGKMFYLNAHFSRLGTSRPIKFYVIQDDHHLSGDALFKLSLYLCYNCARSRDVVSIPIPIKYADDLAYHVKMLLQTLVEEKPSMLKNADLYEQLNEHLDNRKGLEKNLFFI